MISRPSELSPNDEKDKLSLILQSLDFENNSNQSEYFSSFTQEGQRHSLFEQDLVPRTIFYLFPYLNQNHHMKNYQFASIDNPILYRFHHDSTKRFRPSPGHEFGVNHLEFLIDLYNFVFTFNDSGRISVKQYLQVLESSVPSKMWLHPYVQNAPVHLKIPVLFSLSYTMDMRAKDFQAFNFNINLQDRYAEEYHHLYNQMWESSLVNRMELDLMKTTKEFRDELIKRLPSFFDSKTGLVSDEIRILNQKAVQLEDTNAKTLVYSFYATFRQTFRYLSYKHNISGAALFAQSVPQLLVPKSPSSQPTRLAKNSVFKPPSSKNIFLMNQHTPPRPENSSLGSKETKIKTKKSQTPSPPSSSSLSSPKEEKERVSSLSGEPGYNICYCSCCCCCSNNTLEETGSDASPSNKKTGHHSPKRTSTENTSGRKNKNAGGSELQLNQYRDYVVSSMKSNVNQNTYDTGIKDLDSDDVPNYIATSSKFTSMNTKDAIPRKYDDGSEPK